MKYNVYSILLTVALLCTVSPAMADEGIILKQEPGSITFTVDENLPAPENYQVLNVMSEAERLQRLGADRYYRMVNSYIASSFFDTPINGSDAPFFQGMVFAFSDHRPVSLSPDVIWMLISQAFSHEVHADPEKVRDNFVDFDGKTDLIVQTEKRLYDPQFDWTGTVDGFAAQIDAGTKGNLARLLTADFSTTGTIERMASEIVLMETTKSFFEFIEMYLSCGIPSVTLTGTVQDWQNVADKTAELQKLGAGSWAQDLAPILKQFVQAASGHPDRAFWQDMVMKNTPERLRGGACSFEKPTELDGWFLKLLPFDKDGNRTAPEVPYTYKNFPVEMASVPVRYIEIDSISGRSDNIVNLKFSGGIVGYVADKETDCISFPLGWYVSRSDEDNNLQIMERSADSGIELRVSEVPEILRRIRHIRYLTLHFTGEVVIPEWMDNMYIGWLVIDGSMSDKTRMSLKSRFRDRIRFLSNQ